MPPQLCYFRLLPSSSPFLGFSFARYLFSKPTNPLDFKQSSRLTVLSYSGRRGGRGPGSGGGRVLPQRRGSSTLREDRGREKGAVEMEKEGAMGYNKRRAEGMDKSGKPKTLQLKTRKLNPVNTICYVQILGTGMDTQDTSPSVLLFFDKQRFIFNAGEGLQRFCTEHKIKLSKIDHIFLTRVCSETAGGLPGLLLTLAGIGEEGMTVNMWGPSDLNYLIDAMRLFIPNAAMIHAHSFGVTQNGDGASLSSSECSKFKDPIVLIDDEVVRILAIPLRPKYAENAVDNCIASEESTSEFSDTNASGLQSSHSKMGLSLKPGDISVIYSCELPEIKGKFDPAKAASLGLKPGPKFRELQLGNSVKSDLLDIMVHPSDVLGPSSPGPIVLLVDCPTLFHVHELLSKQSLNCYYSDCADQPRENIRSVNCIIHLGPASVTKSVDYQKWMKRFGAAQHIMAGHEIQNVEIPILKSSARISSRLNYLCPQLFPAPGFLSRQQISNSHMVSIDQGSLALCKSISAENLLKFHLRPYSQLGLDRSIIPSPLSQEEIVNELLSEIPEIADVARIVGQFWQRSAECRDLVPPKVDDTIMVEEPWMNERSIIPTSHIEESGEKCSKDDNHSVDDAQWDTSKHNPDIPACLENITREDMEIVLLGTGSSQPSKYRNVSSIFVNLFSKGSLLLDCGEGTLAQLKRRFGVRGADDAVKSLRFIWISHIHADHHCGLVRILALRCQLLKGVPHKPLLVIGPRQLKRFLDAYSRLEHLDMEFLDCNHTTEASMDAFLGSRDVREDWSHENSGTKDNKGAKMGTVAADNLDATLFAHNSKMQSYWKRPGIAVDAKRALPVVMRLKEVLREAGLEVLHSVPVVHCPQAFGVVLKAAKRANSLGETIPGWKLVYSGDTRPCQALIDASLNATVLIHEATFEDSMVDEAIARNHSTTEEAVGVGSSAGVYRIILTHFSQRYPKIPVFDETHMDKTCIAFDLMSVNLADLPVLPKVVPYLKVLFRNEMMADETDDVQEAVM